MKPKPKPRCANCGDETRFPANVDAAREDLGWCVPCYRNWLKTRTSDLGAFARRLPEDVREEGVRVIADYLTAGVRKT